MSALNGWLLSGAMFLAAAYLANAVAYRRRFGTFLRPEARNELKAARVSAGQIAGASFAVVAGMAYIAAHALAPSSSFAQWLREPYSLLIYVVWCVLVAAMIGSLFAVVGFMVKDR